MNLKECIDNLINQNIAVNEFLATVYKLNEADKTISICVEYLNQTKYNSALTVTFANALQFASSPELYEQFELHDIEQLYDSYLQMHDKTNEIYVEAAHFTDAVLDNQVKAKQIIEMGITKLNAQLLELQELSNQLDEQN